MKLKAVLSTPHIQTWWTCFRIRPSLTSFVGTISQHSADVRAHLGSKGEPMCSQSTCFKTSIGQQWKNGTHSKYNTYHLWEPHHKRALRHEGRWPQHNWYDSSRNTTSRVDTHNIWKLSNLSFDPSNNPFSWRWCEEYQCWKQTCQEKHLKGSLT